MNMDFAPGLEGARQLDREDVLRDMRDHFYTRPDMLYMDGNSLGLCSKESEACILHVLDVWKQEAINIWNVQDGKFFLYPSYLGGLLAGLIGANANEVTVTNSTTVNIHQCISTLYAPTKARYKILIDELNFPTDRYAVESQLRLHGYDPAEALVVVQSRDGRTLEEADILSALAEDVALALFPGVLYRSSQLLDIPRITKAAHEQGILIGWDLCHSIGAVPHDFSACEPDFAIWCNYKYLSAGPGAIAGLYLNRRHFGKAPGLAGWHGNKKETQFQLRQQHEPAPDADALLNGTAPLLSMAALEGILQLYREAGNDRLREKSLRITAYLMHLIDTRLAQYGCAVGTPREDAHRGGHVALEHAEAYRICQALKARGVIPDFREPNVVRLAPVALYTRYEDVYRLADILEDILKNKEYEKYGNERALVV